MVNELKTFLSLLYEPKDIIELRLLWDPKEEREDKRRNKKLKIYKHWYTLEELLQSIDYLKGRNEEEYHIFFGVNPRKESRKSGDENVELCRCFFADFDDVAEDATADTIENIVKDEDLPLPTLIIHSGHGFHAYWLLSNNLPPDKWIKPQENLIVMLKADPRSKNLERILRLPGFLNVKKEPFPECKIVKINESNIYDPKEFVKLIKPREEKKKDKVEEPNTKYKWYDFSKLNIPLLLEEVGVETSNQDTDNVYIACVFPEFDHKGEKSSHGGDDSTPSMSVGISGEHCGDIHCFGCGVKCTILEILLYFSDKNIFNKKQKNIIWRRRHELVLKLNERFPGFYILPPCSIYKVNYPADIGEEVAKKYFTIPDDETEGGLIHLFYFESKFYVKKDEVFAQLETYLNPLLWDELKKSKRPGNVLEKFEPQPFPVNQSIVNNVIDALKAIRDIGFQKQGVKLGNIFWISEERFNLPDPKDLIVVSNRTINFKTLETYSNTPNLFCTTSLPVRYDSELPEPELCDKILKENLETEEQIIEHYKRDAYLCRPFVDRTAMFVSIGRTGSGKGLDIHFTKGWLGRFNWVESSLNQLGEKFGLQKWPGTLAAFISEIDEDSVNRIQKGLAVERLKRIAAGDFINIRIPGGEWFDTQLSTKIVIATTMMPTFPRSMEEMSRRIYITEFKKQYAEKSELFPEADKVPDDTLLEQMLKEKDAYFTHRIMKIGMPLLLSEGLKHTDEHIIIMSETVAGASTHARFWDESTITDPNGKLIPTEMLKVFVSWCHINKKETEIRDINVLKLAKRIRQVRKIHTIRSKKEHTTFWCGRSLNEFGRTLLEQYERIWKNSDGADVDSPF